MNTYKKIILGIGPGARDAIDLNYDNTTSGLAATNVQEAIDELSIATGASYIGPFTIGSWLLNVDKYELTIPSSTHGRGNNPILQIYQQNGLNFDEVLTGVEITPIGNVILTVSSSPDLRFAGKIIIK